MITLNLEVRYADVNMWCGDIVKVTPSSKAVGDIALFLVKQGIEPSDSGTLTWEASKSICAFQKGSVAATFAVT